MLQDPVSGLYTLFAAAYRRNILNTVSDNALFNQA